MTVAIEAPRGKRGRPAIRLNSDAIVYWTERVVQKRTDEGFEDIDRNSIIMSGDTLYHYGHHFPLATIFRKANGHARLVMFNGDRYSGASGFGTSTWQVQLEVQRAVRAQIEQSGKNIPTVTIPFSALTAAGIHPTSVRPLEVMDDRTEHEEFSSRERPGPLKRMDDPTGQTFVFTETRQGFIHNDTGEVFKAHQTDEGYLHFPNDRDNWTYGPYTFVEDRPIQVDDPKHCEVEIKSAGWSHDGAELGDDGLWRWTVETHKLGEALFTARYTVTQYRDATDEEKAAQADLDAWSEEYRRAGYPDLDQLGSLGVRPRPDTPDVEIVNRRGYPPVVRTSKTRVEKFLSSYDYAEPHRPYFMCELPHSCPARTIPEALEALAPPDVKLCMAGQLEVLRQGDIFAIETDYTEAELVAQARTTERTFHRSLDCAPWTERLSETVAIRKIGQEGLLPGEREIHGSTHQVTHLIVTTDGRHFGRGRMYHRPGGHRTPEHRILELGDRKTWYRLVKNTVPTDSQGRIRSAGGVQQSGNARAWMLGGMVD